MLVCSAVVLWRRSSWGNLLTGVSMTAGCIMSVTLPASIAVPLVQTGQFTPVAAGPLALLCLMVCMWLGATSGASRKRALLPLKIFRLELLHVHVDDLTKLRPTCDIHRGYCDSPVMTSRHIECNPR